MFAYLNAPTLRFVFEGGPERVRAPFPASRQAKAESKFAKKLKGSPIFGMLARQGKVFSHQPICAYARTTMSFYFWADDLKPETVARGWRPPRGAFPDAARPGAESTHAGAAKVLMPEYFSIKPQRFGLLRRQVRDFEVHLPVI